MALPSFAYCGRIDEKRMGSAGYYEPYRCRKTSTDPISEDKKGSAYISRGASVKAPDFAWLECRASLPAIGEQSLPDLRVARDELPIEDQRLLDNVGLGKTMLSSKFSFIRP